MFAAAKLLVVLVVEDEFLLRMNAVEMIEDAGFEVVQAGNADEAIAILESRFDICVVFTDIQMPGSMDGLKLAAAVRGSWPPIKIHRGVRSTRHTGWRSANRSGFSFKAVHLRDSFNDTSWTDGRLLNIAV